MIFQDMHCAKHNPSLHKWWFSFRTDQESTCVAACAFWWSGVHGLSLSMEADVNLSSSRWFLWACDYKLEDKTSSMGFDHLCNGFTRHRFWWSRLRRRPRLLIDICCFEVETLKQRFHLVASREEMQSICKEINSIADTIVRSCDNRQNRW